MKPEILAEYFDQTLLKANATDADLEKFCRECAAYRFKGAVVNSAQTAKCKAFLRGSDVLLGVTVGFPLGQTTVAIKVAEAKEALENGADEIDYVINVGEMRSRNLSYIENEMREMVALCRAYGKGCKVIFENCYLTDSEKRELCRIASRVKPDYIKTSTGFGTPAGGIAVGATEEDVKLMRQEVCADVKVKAAGGVRTLADALKMIEAGAERIGTSAGVSIWEECRAIEENE